MARCGGARVGAWRVCPIAACAMAQSGRRTGWLEHDGDGFTAWPRSEAAGRC
jgi:hypothetical protein